MARLAANATGVPETTIRSALRRTKSVASSGTRSDFCSANRYSMVIFCPSIHPSLRSSWRNTSTRTALPEGGSRPENLCGRFSCLLRFGGTEEPRAKRSRGRSFSFLLLLPNCPETNRRIENPKCFYFITRSARASTLQYCRRRFASAVFLLNRLSVITPLYLTEPATWSINFDSSISLLAARSLMARAINAMYENGVFSLSKKSVSKINKR